MGKNSAITSAYVRNKAFRGIEGVAQFNKVRSSEIKKSLNIEQLRLRTERSQLRWFGNLSRMPQERLCKQAFLAKANVKELVIRPRTTVNGPIILWILDGIAWEFIQVK